MSTDARIPQQYNQPKHNPLGKAILYIILFALTLVFIGPLLFILNNSFKDSQLYGSDIADDGLGIPNQRIHNTDISNVRRGSHDHQ